MNNASGGEGIPCLVQHQHVVVWWLSHVQLFVNCVTHWVSLPITNSLSFLKTMSIESVMPSNNLILCQPLLLLPSIFPTIRVFSNESWGSIDPGHSGKEAIMWSRADGHVCSELDCELLTILENPVTSGGAFVVLSLHVTHLCHRDAPSGQACTPHSHPPCSDLSLYILKSTVLY